MAAKIKIWSLLMAALCIAVAATGFGIVPIPSISSDYVPQALAIRTPVLVYIALTSLLLVCLWVHCKNMLARVKKSYAQAYIINYRLIDIAWDQAFEMTGQEPGNVAPTRSFKPGLLNRAVDCGRYPMPDGTLSPRVVVRLPKSTHLAIAWFAAKNALHNRLLIWELAPLILCIPVLWSIVHALRA